MTINTAAALVILLLLRLNITVDAASLRLPRFLQGFGVGGNLGTPPPVTIPPQRTAAPTPIITVKPIDIDWETSVFVCRARIYTNNTALVIDAVAAIDEQATSGLQQLVHKQGAPVTVQKLVSEVRGTYDDYSFLSLFEKEALRNCRQRKWRERCYSKLSYSCHSLCSAELSQGPAQNWIAKETVPYPFRILTFAIW